MKNSKLVFTALFAFVGSFTANAQYVIADKDLKNYTLTNDNVMLHLIVALFAVLFLASFITLIVIYRKHNKLVSTNLENELNSENAIAKAGLLEKQIGELRNQIFEQSKIMETQTKKISDHAFDSEKLINKIEILESEVIRKDEKLEEIIKRNHSELLPESKIEIDRLEINFRKLEKTKILSDNSVISEKEYLEIKKKVLSEL